MINNLILVQRIFMNEICTNDMNEFEKTVNKVTEFWLVTVFAEMKKQCSCSVEYIKLQY